MEFRVLGPVEARRDGRALPVRGAKQCGMLALLLFDLNKVVTFERLVDEVWGEDPPDSRNTVTRLASRLRAALGPGYIAGHPAGYVLTADPERIDLSRFEGLAARGRAALEVGSPSRAAKLLGEALEEWRGPALTGAAEPVRELHVQRLEEARLAALENRIEADLALGAHARLVGELHGLVSRHRWRERLAGQLMTALYRSGRQAEALEVYERSRTTLATELGLNPGEELRDLQRRILADDPALRPTRSRRAGRCGPDYWLHISA